MTNKPDKTAPLWPLIAIAIVMLAVVVITTALLPPETERLLFGEVVDSCPRQIWSCPTRRWGVVDYLTLPAATVGVLWLVFVDDDDESET